MTEDELETVVIQLAHHLGYVVAGFRPGRTLKGWRTPVKADGKGWPDLVLCNGERTLFRELKGDGGRVSPDQTSWLNRLEDAGLDAGLWTPAAWRSGRIERELRGEPLR